MKDFLLAFAQFAGLDNEDAAEQWAGFSRQLADNERSTIEAGGYNSGMAEGRRFAKLYPVELPEVEELATESTATVRPACPGGCACARLSGAGGGK